MCWFEARTRSSWRAWKESVVAETAGIVGEGDGVRDAGLSVLHEIGFEVEDCDAGTIGVGDEVHGSGVEIEYGDAGRVGDEVHGSGVEIEYGDAGIVGVGDKVRGAGLSVLHEVEFEAGQFDAGLHGVGVVCAGAPYMCAIGAGGLDAGSLGHSVVVGHLVVVSGVMLNCVEVGS